MADHSLLRATTTGWEGAILPRHCASLRIDWELITTWEDALAASGFVTGRSKKEYRSSYFAGWSIDAARAC